MEGCPVNIIDFLKVCWVKPESSQNIDLGNSSEEENNEIKKNTNEANVSKVEKVTDKNNQPDLFEQSFLGSSSETINVTETQDSSRKPQTEAELDVIDCKQNETEQTYTESADISEHFLVSDPYLNQTSYKIASKRKSVDTLKSYNLRKRSSLTHLSPVSSDNDPDWRSHPYKTQRKYKNRRKRRRTNVKQKCYSEPSNFSYGLRNRSTLSNRANTENTKENEKNADTVTPNEEITLDANKWMLNLETAMPDEKDIYEDKYLSEYIRAKKQKPASPKLMETNLSSLNSRKPEKNKGIIISFKKNQRELDQRRNSTLMVKKMLLDVESTLNQIKATLTDWKYESRLPTSAEATCLLKKIKNINKNLKEEYDMIKENVNQMGILETFLGLMKKSEVIYYSILRRIKKLNKKNSLSATFQSCLPLLENLKIDQDVQKQDINSSNSAIKKSKLIVNELKNKSVDQSCFDENDQHNNTKAVTPFSNSVDFCEPFGDRFKEQSNSKELGKLIQTTTTFSVQQQQKYTNSINEQVGTIIWCPEQIPNSIDMKENTTPGNFKNLTKIARSISTNGESFQEVTLFRNNRSGNEMFRSFQNCINSTFQHKKKVPSRKYKCKEIKLKNTSAMKNSSFGDSKYFNKENDFTTASNNIATKLQNDLDNIVNDTEILKDDNILKTYTFGSDVQHPSFSQLIHDLTPSKSQELSNSMKRIQIEGQSIPRETSIHFPFIDESSIVSVYVIEGKNTPISHTSIERIKEYNTGGDQNSELPSSSRSNLKTNSLVENYPLSQLANDQATSVDLTKSMNINSNEIKTQIIPEFDIISNSKSYSVNSKGQFLNFNLLKPFTKQSNQFINCENSKNKVTMQSINNHDSHFTIKPINNGWIIHPQPDKCQVNSSTQTNIRDKITQGKNYSLEEATTNNTQNHKTLNSINTNLNSLSANLANEKSCQTINCKVNEGKLLNCNPKVNEIGSCDKSLIERKQNSSISVSGQNTNVNYNFSNPPTATNDIECGRSNHSSFTLKNKCSQQKDSENKQCTLPTSNNIGEKENQGGELDEIDKDGLLSSAPEMDIFRQIEDYLPLAKQSSDDRGLILTDLNIDAKASFMGDIRNKDVESQNTSSKSLIKAPHYAAQKEQDKNKIPQTNLDSFNSPFIYPDCTKAFNSSSLTGNSKSDCASAVIIGHTNPTTNNAHSSVGINSTDSDILGNLQKSNGNNGNTKYDTHNCQNKAKFSIENIKYLREKSSGEFLQIDDFSDLNSPNIFIW